MKTDILQYIALTTAVLAASACIKEDYDSNPMIIRLESGVCSSPVDTKALQIYDYDTNEGLDFSILRWDEGESERHQGKSYIDARMGTPDAANGWRRKVTFDVMQQYYKDRTKEVGFMGVFPRIENANWTLNTNGSLSYRIDGETDVMVSEGRRGNFSTGIPTIPFSHGLCHYRIWAYAVDEESKDTWGDITSVKLQNLPEDLNVSFDPDLIGMEIPMFTYSGMSEDKELITDINGVELGSTFDDRILLGELLGGAPVPGMIGVAVASKNQVDNEGKPLGNVVSIARNFKPGYTYNIVLRFSEHGRINAVLTVEDWRYEKLDYESNQDTDLYTDLSYNGTANSYIVSTANLGYCFKATIKGNGVNSFTGTDGTVFNLPSDSDKEDVNLDIDYVEIAGQYGSLKYDEDANDGTYLPVKPEDQIKADMLELVSPHITNGYIRFKAKGFVDEDGLPIKGNHILPYKGNARINAYKNGRVVWSWHIWVTDRPLDVIYRNGYISMDRNLGAVSNSPDDYNNITNTVNGICYQFGRKDPMFRYLIENNGSTYVIKKEVTVDEATANPRVYYWNDNNNWTAQNSDHFWGYASPREGAHKTMYDPCPPGYKVPVRAMFDYVVDDAEIVDATTPINGIETGFTIKTKTADETVYYPQSFLLARGGVVRNNDDFSKEPQVDGLNSTYLYTATPADDPDYAYHFSFDIDEYNKAVSDNKPYTALQSTMERGGRRANAFPVRCVKEGSGLATVKLDKYQSANSYIVSEKGYYTFQANVRGNGMAGLFSLADKKYEEIDAGLGASFSKLHHVDILWWQGDLTKDSDFRKFAEASHSDLKKDIEKACPVKIIGTSKEEGVVMFYVNDLRPANVGLAAYDQDNNILWSWHIWINTELEVVKLGEFGVLNAQLGATYIPKNSGSITEDNFDATLGYYYQWGRKDPMFQQNMPYYVKDRYGNWSKKTGMEYMTKKSIEESIKNPTLFFQGSGNYWQTTLDNPDKATMSHFWGYAGSTGVGDSFLKTMWDPCPPGYKLIDHKTFNSAAFATHDCPGSDTGGHRSTLYNTDYSKYGLFVKPGVQSNVSGNSIKSDQYDVIIGAQGLWFPFGGFISEAGTYSDHGSINYTTSACPLGYKGFRLFFTGYNGTEQKGNYYVDDDWKEMMGRGMNARCLKE